MLSAWKSANQGPRCEHCGAHSRIRDYSRIGVPNWWCDFCDDALLNPPPPGPALQVHSSYSVEV